MPRRSSSFKSVHRPRTAAGLLAAALGVLAAVLPANAMAAVSAGDRYVSLGDSYTAGPLIPPPNKDFPGCIKSLNNYPHLVADDLKLELTDVSCSGAKTTDMTKSQDVSPNPDPPPQFSALNSTTKVVTITISGNDIGFSEISENCASTSPTGTPCQDHYVQNGRDEIHERIEATAPKVARVLQGIHKHAKNAAVYMVNYLPILPVPPPDEPRWTIDNRVSGHGCWPTVPITDGDAGYVVAKEEELNKMLATQAAANNATLVDGYAAGTGHDACKDPGTRWVEPEVAPVGAAPLHPNLDGMQGYAKAVEGKF